MTARYVKYHRASGTIVGVSVSGREPVLPEDLAFVEVDLAADYSPATHWFNGSEIVERVPAAVAVADPIPVDGHLVVTSGPGHWLQADGLFYQCDGDGRCAVPVEDGRLLSLSLGGGSSGLVEVMPLDLEAVKRAQREVINAARDAAEWAGVQTPFGLFDSDQKSQVKIAGAVQAATILPALGQTFQMDWTLADDSNVTLTGEQMIQAGLMVLAHVNATFQRSRILKQRIEDATDAAAVQAVTWTDSDAG